MSRLRTLATQTKIGILPAEPTVTVMKADSRLQVDPSTVCVIDAKSAFDHPVPESTGSHCKRTAQELCVTRRSMQALRARCRWVPHERIVVDALTKRHGKQYHDAATEKHKRNLRPHRLCSQRKKWNVTDETQWAVLIRSKPMRPLVQ